MKVCHLITRMIQGGAQENTLLTLKGLKRDTGWELHLVCGPEIGEEGSLVEETRKLGVTIDSLHHLRRNLHPWHDAMALRELKEYLARERFDLVHTHSAKAGILGRIAARQVGVPRIVHTVHGLAFDEYQPAWRNAIYRAAERMAASRTDRFIAVCRIMAERALEAGMGNPSIMRVIYSGFPMAEFLALGPPSRGEGFVVGMVARMFPLKGHEDLMKLAPRLLGQQPDLRLLLLGDGPMRRDWERWVADHAEWRDRIEFAGRVPPSEVASQVARMDLVLQLSWREGLARTLPQALAAARPVCTYDIGGAKEIVQNDETGWIVPPGDLDGVAKAVHSARSTPDHARKLALRGREKVRELFDVETMQRQILELYREMGLSS
jgi:glycosyltransferase involved in cell wall biosynthesis